MSDELLFEEDVCCNDSGINDYEEWYFSEEQKLEETNKELRIYSNLLKLSK